MEEKMAIMKTEIMHEIGIKWRRVIERFKIP
jgi:transposase